MATLQLATVDHLLGGHERDLSALPLGAMDDRHFLGVLGKQNPLPKLTLVCPRC